MHHVGRLLCLNDGQRLFGVCYVKRHRASDSPIIFPCTGAQHLIYAGASRAAILAI